MPQKHSPVNNRLLSLDAFRGIAIAGMILVNNFESNTYPQLNHAVWNGWTVADTVFPFFLWIMGVAMVFSLQKRVAKDRAKKTVVFHILLRSLILFIIGMLLYSFPYYNLHTIRIPGVLQRIAICYLVGSLIFLHTKIRGQILWIISLLTIYLLLLKFVPIPGYSTGILDKERNIVQYMDVLFLKGHLYSQTWDPEGILSTLGATATTLFGILTGQLLVIGKSAPIKKVMLMISSGIYLLLLGLILDRWLPINKTLWTSSYAVFMAGLVGILFSFFFFFIYIKGYKTWHKPLAIYGLNSIALYIFSIIMSKLLMMIRLHNTSGWDFILINIYYPLAGSKNASLLWSLTLVLFFYEVAYVMYKKNWILRI